MGGGICIGDSRAASRDVESVETVFLNGDSLSSNKLVIQVLADELDCPIVDNHCAGSFS